MLMRIKDDDITPHITAAEMRRQQRERDSERDRDSEREREIKSEREREGKKL